MNIAHRGPIRSKEYIDIHLPRLGGDDDNDNDEEDDDANNVISANVNAAGVAAHRLQLPPLPANATREQLENVSSCHAVYVFIADVAQAYREAQLALQVQSEAEERRTLEVQALVATNKAKKKGGQSRDLPPPPELAHIEELLMQIAHEFCVLISLWPPAAYWPYVTLERPAVDPYDADTRYPVSGTRRVRGTRGQDIAAEALRTASIAELHDFMGNLSVHLTNKWVQAKVCSLRLSALLHR